MSSPHEHDDRELVSHMERALASAVATGTALIEAFMRRQQRDADRRAREAATRPAADDANAAAESHGIAANRAAIVNAEARHALGVGASDPSFWHTASETAIAEKIRTDYGADPSRIGDRDHDRHWATRADAGEVLDVYGSARRWQHSSLATEMMADNISELLGEYGVDVDHVASLPREEGAELLATARAGHHARPDAEDERDADTIAHLVADRDTALDIAARDSAQADHLDELSDAMTRDTELVDVAREIPQSEALHAAAVAINDHPTRPSAAVSNAPKNGAVKARPARGRGRGTGPQRGHGM
ncbi:hypothetical protein [uncultured Williamsia sp.]|uniref:hypothetical protein n=1 Tax=uncultured Williamsia sp. TaxID=259311 RepID=UPI002636C3C2|nr:hypothetical protein [uncultured Williamsia sp.]